MFRWESEFRKLEVVRCSTLIRVFDNRNFLLSSRICVVIPNPKCDQTTRQNHHRQAGETHDTDWSFLCSLYCAGHNCDRMLYLRIDSQTEMGEK